MGLYKLIKGSHTSGVGTTTRQYRWNDPQNCIVESKEDLSVTNPEKFTKYEGPPPRMSRIPRGEVQPPQPVERPSNVMEDLVPMSADERRSKAEELRRRADELEEAAKQQESGEEENEEAAEHVRSNFAKSDSASAFEEAGRKKLEAQERSMQAARRPTPKASSSQDEEQGEEGEEGNGEAQEGEEGQETTEGSEVAEEQPVDDGLDTFSIAQLRGTATKERIDVSKAKTRTDLLNTIRTSRANKPKTSR